jgi:hypothetical protein
MMVEFSAGTDSSSSLISFAMCSRIMRMRSTTSRGETSLSPLVAAAWEAAHTTEERLGSEILVKGEEASCGGV